MGMPSLLPSLPPMAMGHMGLPALGLPQTMAPLYPGMGMVPLDTRPPPLGRMSPTERQGTRSFDDRWAVGRVEYINLSYYFYAFIFWDVLGGVQYGETFVF